MSDQRLRALSRLEGVEAKARLIKERLRSGQIPEISTDKETTLSPRDRVKLAAFLGDEPSRLALGYQKAGQIRLPEGGSTVYFIPRRVKRISGEKPLSVPNILKEWVTDLSDWGDEVCVRAEIAAAFVALGPFEDHEACESAHDYGDCEMALQAIEAAENWVLEPGIINATALRSACAKFGSDDPKWAVFLFLKPYHPEDIWKAPCSSGAVEATSDERVRSAIMRELIPWALAERDPVRERAGIAWR